MRSRFKPIGGTKRGFTLLEFVVTIAVLLVVLAIGLPGITGWMRRTELSTAEANLGHLIAEAKRVSIQTGMGHEVRFDPKRHQLILSVPDALPNQPTTSPGPIVLGTPHTMDKSMAIAKSIKIEFLSDRNGSPLQALRFSPQGIVSSAQIRIFHSSGIQGEWKTNRLTGGIQPISSRVSR